MQFNAKKGQSTGHYIVLKPSTFHMFLTRRVFAPKYVVLLKKACKKVIIIIWGSSPKASAFSNH